MAFKKQVETTLLGETLLFEEGYHQVTDVHGTKEMLNYSITIYKDDSKEHVISREHFSFVPEQSEESVRWDKQCYGHAKTLPQFTDAIDC